MYMCIYIYIHTRRSRAFRQPDEAERKLRGDAPQRGCAGHATIVITAIIIRRRDRIIVTLMTIAMIIVIDTKSYFGSKHYATTARHHCHRLLNRPHTLQYASKLYLFKQIGANIVNYKDSKPTISTIIDMS